MVRVFNCVVVGLILTDAIVEMVYCKAPFEHQNRTELFQMITSSTKHLKFIDDPILVDVNHLISKLLSPDAHRRLGTLHGGIDDIKQHRFFETDSFPWNDLELQQLAAPNHNGIALKRTTSWHQHEQLMTDSDSQEAVPNDFLDNF